ncbi:MAG: NACHT domain-containing protein [Clostridiales bacterium]|nr:NACHT domain-containing protein [Clostridiales bacterium]
MNFSEFCNNFYADNRDLRGIRKISSQGALAAFFIETALGYEEGRELERSISATTKWFTGERNVAGEFWVDMKKQFDKDHFFDTLLKEINDSALSRISRKFGISTPVGEEVDKLAIVYAVTEQFNSMIEGNGEADNIVPMVYKEKKNTKEFSEYIEKSYNKYSKLKTLLYTSEERPFDEFFVCNQVCYTPHKNYRSKKDEVIENVTLEDLAVISPCVLLVGMGGIGKSMMMRHLFLVSNQAYNNNGKIPILVTLREFGMENSELFEIIVDSVHRFEEDFTEAKLRHLLAAGKCQLLLDGLDEIKIESVGDFQHQLELLIDMYPNNQYVMSTRMYSNFVELSRFKTMWVLPFEREQSLELIDKLVFCPESPQLKDKFRTLLEEELFKTHEEFVTNPLLLTLMLMNYRFFAEVPEKKYLFYEQAYQTLLQRHDASKLAYKRVFHSVRDTSDFTKVFSEFCAKSYRKKDYEFDRAKFDKYFEGLQSKKRLNLAEMTSDNFLFDVCNSACLMYEEGNAFHFLHRSFQEYFFAEYYSRQDDNTLLRLGDYMDRYSRSRFDESDAMEMLYDLAPEKVEKFIFMPYLEKIFGGNDKKEEFWRFLDIGFKSWSYVAPNPTLEDKYTNSESVHHYNHDSYPDSDIMDLILRIYGGPNSFSVDADMSQFIYPEFITQVILGRKYGHSSKGDLYTPSYIVEKEALSDTRFVESVAKRHKMAAYEDGKLVEFAHVYRFDFELVFSEPDKYQDIQELLNGECCTANDLYIAVKEYYEHLKISIEEQEYMDDDF